MDVRGRVGVDARTAAVSWGTSGITGLPPPRARSATAARSTRSVRAAAVIAAAADGADHAQPGLGPGQRRLGVQQRLQVRPVGGQPVTSVPAETGENRPASMSTAPILAAAKIFRGTVDPAAWAFVARLRVRATKYKDPAQLRKETTMK